MEIKVVSYEESRLDYFRKQRNRLQKRFDQFEKSETVKEMPFLERYETLSEMGEIISYYDSVIAMLEEEKFKGKM